MDCLDEETVVAFVGGALQGPALAAVERHLVGCPACATLVALAAPPAPTDPASAGQAPALDSLVGRYRLVRLVGRGGMGEVYAAYDPELDRRVAIKILRHDASPGDIEAARLLREAQAVAKLSHPNVVAIYDVGTAEGRIFLAMELVEGETLATWLDRRRRSVGEILRMFAMAGRGLAAAHRVGIVHRDFKPQNVMVSDDDTARVMDFGLAARGESATEHQPRLTRAGSILGTPLYMSPEQFRGQPVDPRADQFSFCVALWEALSGGRPFEGATLLELRAAVLAGRPRPGPLRSRMPRRIRAALERGLSVDRSRRFPDMTALLAALAGTPKQPGRQTVLVVGAAALALLGGVALVSRIRASRSAATCDPTAKLAGVWESGPEGRPRREMRVAFLATDVPDARQRFERTSQILDNYADGWLGLSRDACEAVRDGAEPVTALRARCLDRRRAELAALTDALAHADTKVVRRAIGAALSLHRTDSCNDLGTLEAAFPPPAEPRARARVDLLTGRLLALRARAETGHDWQEAEPIGTLTEEIRAAAYEPLLTEALLVQARVRSPFDPEAAVPLYEEAYRHALALHGDEFSAEATIQLTAIVGTFQHRFAEGERWAGRAEVALGHGGGLERLRGWFLNVRGTLEAARGQWRQAEADFTSSVSIREQALGPAHPELAASLVNLAKSARALDDPARAFEAAERAFKIVSAIYPADAYEVAAALLARGEALVDLKRPAEARADIQTVLAGFERTLGRDHPFLADPMTALGRVALLEGRPADARAVLEHAWEIRATQVADGGAREETAFNLARAIWGSSELDRPHALELARDARDGYMAIPDLSSRLAAVQTWIEARADAADADRHAQRR
jgi:tRNA A-37 threonylcarbamoyl transferase component Bud32/tetratricopeptide (TPR) repeat protein